MKLAPVLAAVLLAAVSAPRAAVAASQSKDAKAEAESRKTSLAEVSRAFTTIDDAERMGDLETQRSLWVSVAAVQPNDVGTRTLAAYALPHSEENWADLKAVADQHPESATPWVAICRVYLEWGVLDQVDLVLPVARQAERSNWLVDLVRGQLAERRGQAAAATAAFKQVLVNDPGNVDAHVGLAKLAMVERKEATAQVEAEAALAVLPGHAPALQILATLAEGRNDLKEATTLYFKIIIASSRDRVARMKLARMLDAQGDAVGARDQYKAALALKEDAETLLALADAARRTKDGPTEARALERLAQLDPGGAEWRRIADIRNASNDPAGAEKALRQAVARDPKDPQTLLAFGRQLARMGRSQEALEYLRAAGDPAAADRAALERKINLVKQTRPDVNALQQTVGGLIDRTYRARLKDAPRLTGKLVIKVASDAAGRAAQVDVIEDTLRDEDVRACAYWNLKDAAYPPNKPGRFTFSFTLRPAN